MAALYHALGTSWILEGLTLLWGLGERREGIGFCELLRCTLSQINAPIIPSTELFASQSADVGTLN